MLAEAERSYEVYQRQAATDIPVAIPPGFWLRPEFVADPYPTLALLREHYRCFRDWHTNTYWVTSYDEVTSLIADDANFAARPRHATYGAELFGRDLRDEPLVRDAMGFGMQSLAEIVARRAADELRTGGADLIGEFVRPFTVGLLARIVGIPDGDAARFGDLWRAMHEGVGWHPGRADAGVRAIAELGEMVAQHLAAVDAGMTPSLLSAARACCDDASVDDVSGTSWRPCWSSTSTLSKARSRISCASCSPMTISWRRCLRIRTWPCGRGRRRCAIVLR